MSCSLVMQGRGSPVKPNDLVSCHRDTLIDRPFSPTAASQNTAVYGNNGSGIGIGHFPAYLIIT